MFEIVVRESKWTRLTVAVDRVTLKVPVGMSQTEIDGYHKLAEGIAAIVQPGLKKTLRGDIKKAQFAHDGNPVYIWCSRVVVDGPTLYFLTKS